MKEVIRKLKIFKFDKELLGTRSKNYLVVYRNGYDLLSKSQLEELLLHPPKNKDFRYIFDWEDRLNITTEFVEME